MNVTTRSIFAANDGVRTCAGDECTEDRFKNHEVCTALTMVLDVVTVLAVMVSCVLAVCDIDERCSGFR